MSALFRITFPLLIITSLQATTETYWGKTFLRARAPGSGLLMRPLTSGVRGSASTGPEGISLQATPFYQWSHNRSDLGKYFGMLNETTDTIDDYIGVDSDGTTELLYSGDIIHGTDRTGAPTDQKLRDSVQLRPERKLFGVRLDCCIDLGSTDELQLRVGFPVLHVKTSLGARSTSTNQRQATLPGLSTKVTLLDYLAGNVTNLSTNYLQEALARMKILSDGTSLNGMGDIEAALSWCAFARERGAARIAVVGTIPIQKLPNGTQLFEPQTTNGGHVGIGLGLYSRFAISDNPSHNTTFFADVEFRYFFRNDEIRAPLFTHDGTTPAAWPLLLLGGEYGQKGTFPLANKLTQECHVKPGALLEASLGLNIANHVASLSLGYNLYARAAEKVELISWDDDTYGAVDYNYDTANNFAGTYAYPANQFINTNHLLPAYAQTPTQISHRIFASLSLQPANNRYFFGLGSFGDIYSHNNASLKEIGIWARAGMSF